MKSFEEFFASRNGTPMGGYAFGHELVLDVINRFMATAAEYQEAQRKDMAKAFDDLVACLTTK